MISAAVIAAGMLASCSNKEIVDEQPETDGVSASVLNIVPTVGTGHEGRASCRKPNGGK